MISPCLFLPHAQFNDDRTMTMDNILLAYQGWLCDGLMNLRFGDAIRKNTICFTSTVNNVC